MEKIKGYPGYLVHADGYVWSTKAGRKLKPSLNIDGYPRVQLYNDDGRQWFFVHRLVAIAFKPNPKKKPEVNHDDWDRLNSAASNLTWMTSSENKLHNRKKPWPRTPRGDCPF